MDIITDNNEYEIIRSKVAQMLKGDNLPLKVFQDHFMYFIFSDFDTLFTRPFFEGWTSFLIKTQQKEFIYYVIEPDPKEYFFLNFRFYSIIKGKANSNYESFLSLINLKPMGISADAIIHNSNLICIFSSNENVIIYGDRENELAIIGFLTLDERVKFINVFNKRIGFFKVKDAIEILKETVFKNQLTSNDVNFFFKTLENNYSV